MGEAQVGGPDGPRVMGSEEMTGRFYAELTAAIPAWMQRLAGDPKQFGPLEHDVQAAFARGADLVLTGLLALVMKQPAFDAACEQTRRHSRYPLRRGRRRTLRVRLPGGLVEWITSLYCAPAKRRSAEADVTAPGLHLELAQFGFGKGGSPALESKVGRQAALCPSFQLAVAELERKRA